jgi:hypothetical protein
MQSITGSGPPRHQLRTLHEPCRCTGKGDGQRWCGGGLRWIEAGYQSRSRNGLIRSTISDSSTCPR